MSYQVLVVASARKEIKKLDKQVRDKVLQVIEALSISPMAGVPLRGVLKDVWCYHLLARASSIAWPIKFAKGSFLC